MDEASDDQIWCACTPTPERTISDCERCAMDWAQIRAAGRWLAHETEQVLKFKANARVVSVRRDPEGFDPLA